MPSPWLIARTSGLYCRVFVPTDLRPTLGRRFLVRALDARDRDQARLIAAHNAIALGDLFRQLRQHLSMSCKVDPTRARFSEDFDVVKTAGQLPAQLAFGDHSSFDRA